MTNPSVPPTSPALEATIRHLRRLVASGYFGNLVVSLRNGQITVLRQEETIIPENIPAFEEEYLRSPNAANSPHQSCR